MERTHIEWKKNLTLGDDEIDAQHKKLISLIDDVGNCVNSSNSDDELKTAVVKYIGAMSDYVMFHFMAEEKRMSDTGYPLKKWHVKQHRTFTDQVDVYKKHIDEEKEISIHIVMEIYYFLVDWLNNHILYTDKKLVEYLSGGDASDYNTFDL